MYSVSTGAEEEGRGKCIEIFTEVTKYAYRQEKRSWCRFIQCNSLHMEKGNMDFFFVQKNYGVGPIQFFVSWLKVIEFLATVCSFENVEKILDL